MVPVVLFNESAPLWQGDASRAPFTPVGQRQEGQEQSGVREESDAEVAGAPREVEDEIESGGRDRRRQDAGNVQERDREQR